MVDANDKLEAPAWMQPHEVWVFERVLAGETAYLWNMPQKVRDAVGDGDKDAVKAPLEPDDDGVPQPIDDARWPEWQVLRAECIEYLLTNKTFIAKRRRNQIWIESAWIRERLQLSQADCPGDIQFDRCRIDANLEFLGTQIGGLLSFQGSHLPEGLIADGLQLGGSLYLSGGARFEGEVRLLTAKIAGVLSCIGSHFVAGASGDALSCDGMQLGASLFLNDGARFEGAVRLHEARIVGVLSCIGSHFVAGASGRALSCDGMQLGGSLYLREKADVKGIISLTRAKISGHVQLWGSRIDGVMDLSGLTVTGELWLNETERSHAPPEWGAATRLNLTNARIGTLHGSLTAWKRPDGSFVPMQLDGLKIDRLAGGDGGRSLDSASPEDIVAWVEAGCADRGTEHGFAQSPYVMLANVLQAEGREDRARDVLIALERRKTDTMTDQKWRRVLFRRPLGWLNRYGYKPYRGLGMAVGVWAFFAVWGFAWSDIMVPTERPEGVFGWFKEAVFWAGFSLEQIIPFVDLDPIQDNFLQNQFGFPTNEHGYADATQLPPFLRATFMLERVIGLIILSFSIVGITGALERRG